jgi:Asp/Glu/hydantoin racemase
MTPRSAAAVLSALIFTGISALPAAALERFCVKDHNASFKNASIACYTDSGCAFVEGIGAEPIRDFPKTSVAAALGRGKIDGIMTTSPKIIRKIAQYGYSCQ